jgi:hypothetical protein
MRPKGAVHLALLDAVEALATPDRGATLRELAHHTCVGTAAARLTLSNLLRSGAVEIARTRRVTYRNRPVAEYALPQPKEEVEPTAGGVLASALSAWHTNP